MVGPNKQFDKDQVLMKAMNVFWEKGYEATSMQDLVSSMGINRASMYQTYGNKYALFVSTIDCYVKMTFGMIDSALSQSGSPLDNLSKLFKLMIEHSLTGKQQGCLINNTAVEIAPHDPEISKTLRQFWKKMDKIIEHQLQNAVNNNELKSDADPKQLAFLLNSNLQGLMVLSKTNPSKNKLFENLDMLFNLISK